jgi:RNA polymerase-binding transcription factor DksA
MNKNKLKKFQRQLLDLSARLQGDIQSLDDQTRTATGGDSAGSLSNTPLHLADMGTAVYLQELNATLLENQEYIRDEVLHALKRIDEGTYGNCENCGRPILEERLELLPYTRYCTACAAALQAGKEVNLNEGRPKSGADTLDPTDDEDGDENERRGSGRRRQASTARADDIPTPDIELLDPAQRVGGTDIHAVGTPGGGTAVGGLAGTNIGEGDPDEANLEEAVASGNFDVAIEGDDNPAIAYSGPAGGAVGGTPANRRAVGGKLPGAHGIVPKPEPGDSPTGP